MNKKIVFLFLLIIAFFYIKQETYAQNKDAIDFYLKNYNNKRAKKSDFKGKVILVIITASWDLDFNNSIHKIKDLQREFSSKDVEFMYIVGDLPQRWKTFADDKGLKGNFYYLPSMSKGCKSCFLSEHFDETEITSYYIISKDGSLLNGFLPSPDKNTGIHQLLIGASTL